LFFIFRCMADWHNIYTIDNTSKQQTMENSTQTILILKALDIELLTILTADLEAFEKRRKILLHNYNIKIYL
jgi:hypothetical protein